MGNPCAANNTIRARDTSPARTELDRVNASNRDRSPSRKTSGAATDMTHCPAPPTVNKLTTRDTRHLGRSGDGPAFIPRHRVLASPGDRAAARSAGPHVM